MAKRELGIRERRRIYEDTICIVAQNQKMTATASRERVMKNAIEKQNSRCVSILATVLGNHETTVESEEMKMVMIVPDDDNQELMIEKKKFEEIVQQLPNNKELRETLWKAHAKRDKKAIAKLGSLI
jgi:hypothetical protein